MDSLLATKVGNTVDVSKICLRTYGAVVELAPEGRLEEVLQLQCFDGGDEFETGD